MTLKLVADNGEAVEVGGPTLAEELGALANQIDGAATVVALVFGPPSVSGLRVLGEDLTDHELIGIFEAAKFDVLRDILEGD